MTRASIPPDIRIARAIDDGLIRLSVGIEDADDLKEDLRQALAQHSLGAYGDLLMPSPFPGMDPFIEVCGLWEDFHPKLIGEIERALAAVVPDRYFVGLGTRSYIVVAGSEGKESHPFLPDVGVASAAGESAAKETAGAETTTESQAVGMQAFVAEPFRETFIEILEDDPKRRLVTAIEVLSPSNKRRRSKGRKLYLRKRQALLLGAANLVEIDLLRGGQHMPMMTPWPDSPYRLLVSRQEHAPYCTVWPAHFQRPLPIIPVPLASPDKAIQLDLQPLVNAVYARARYANHLDYSRPLQPALTENESAWLAEQLRMRS